MNEYESKMYFLLFIDFLNNKVLVDDYVFKRLKREEEKLKNN